MRKRSALVALFAVLALVLSACGGSGNQQTTAPAPDTTQPAAPDSGQSGGSSGPAGSQAVSILSLWGGSEQEAFQKVLDGFTAKTGIKTQYEQARDFVPVLRTRLAGGNPPAVAIVPRPGVMADLAREGSLKSLADLGITDEMMKESYGPAWIDLGTVDGQLYGIVVKANSKSTIWYNPQSFQELNVQPPGTWGELLALSEKYVQAGKTPWAVGGKDSWTLTDWFENIYVRTAGPDKYTDLFGGQLAFTDASVAEAASQMTQIVARQEFVAGGTEGVLGTGFVDGIGRAFGKNADAEMYFEGGFVGGIALKDVNPELRPGETIAFFPFPEINASHGSPLIGGGDLLVVFADTPEVRQFVQYMISKEAGEIWAATGAIVSPNRQVDLSVYPTELTRAEAQQVAAAQAFRFDGSDLLPGSLADEWGTTLQAMVERPTEIPQLLADFESKAAVEFKR